MKVPLFYKSKPIFGLDIGTGTAKVVQIRNGRQPQVTGYGYTGFPADAVQDGEVVKPEAVANSLSPFIKESLVGKLTTERAVASLPIARTYTRILSLPSLEDQDLNAAVELEAEQYLPVPLDELYLDYKQLPQYATDNQDQSQEVLMVATPKKIVDSYINLFDALGLEVFVIEPSLFAIMRAVDFGAKTDLPKIVIDFGSRSSDLAIHDQTIRFTGTIDAGGDHITEAIAEALNIEPKDAHTIKTRFGIGESKWQETITKTVEPTLSRLGEEIKKLIRYYQDRTEGQADIKHIELVGGGANLPGLQNYIKQLTDKTVEVCNPWKGLAIEPLQPPHQLELTLYSTAIGLALRELER